MIFELRSRNLPKFCDGTAVGSSNFPFETPKGKIRVRLNSSLEMKSFYHHSLWYSLVP